MALNTGEMKIGILDVSAGLSKKEDFIVKERRDSGSPICPHCGTILYSRKEIRDHLTLNVCQNGKSESGIDPIRRRELEK